jgi:hypothetical protein
MARIVEKVKTGGDEFKDYYAIVYCDEETGLLYTESTFKLNFKGLWTNHVYYNHTLPQYKIKWG